MYMLKFQESKIIIIIIIIWDKILDKKLDFIGQMNIFGDRKKKYHPNNFDFLKRFLKY